MCKQLPEFANQGSADLQIQIQIQIQEHIFSCMVKRKEVQCVSSYLYLQTRGYQLEQVLLNLIHELN